jgi:hypothetical protein
MCSGLLTIAPHITRIVSFASPHFQPQGTEKCTVGQEHATKANTEICTPFHSENETHEWSPTPFLVTYNTFPHLPICNGLSSEGCQKHKVCRMSSNASTHILYIPKHQVSLYTSISSGKQNKLQTSDAKTSSNTYCKCWTT